MLYKLIRKADGNVIGSEIAGDWRGALYKLQMAAEDYARENYPDKQFAGMRETREGETAYFVVKSENGQEVDVLIGLQKPVAHHHPVIREDGPITPRQAAFIRRHGHDVPRGATKRWAAAVIADILDS